MCEAKVKIPFLKQEINSQDTLPLKDIKITYKDPTLIEDLNLYTFRSAGAKLDGKINIGLSGEICDFGDHLEGKGTLKFEKVVAGPYETEGGVIQFKRLFIHFNNLEIPIQLYYEYDSDTLCGPEGLTGANKKKGFTGDQMNGFTGKNNGFTGEQKNGITGEGIKQILGVLGGDFDLPKGTVDNTGVTGSTGATGGSSGGTGGSTGATGATGSIRNPFEIILDISSNGVSFDKYFVTNGLNETNMNMIFNNLESQFKEKNSIFQPVYQTYIQMLNKTELSGLVEKEMNRIYCLYKNKKIDKKEEITPQIVYYNEKIQRLKIQGDWKVFFN